MKIIEELTDNYIAIVMITAGIGFIACGITVPEWFILGIGLVLAFYFKK